MTLTPLRINPPMKGVNTITPIREMSHEYAVRLDNIWMDKAGGLQRRPGQTTVINPVANSTDRIFEYVTSAGAIEIYKYEGVGNVILKRSGASWVASPFGTYTSIPNVCQLGSQLIISDGTLTEYYNGAAVAVPAGLTTSPIDNHCKFFCAHAGRIYGAGSASYQTVVFFCDVLADGATSTLGVADWTIGVSGPGGYVDASGATGKGSPVTGITSFQGLLVIFCKNSIVFYSGTDPLGAGLTVQKVITGVGCVSHDTIAGIGNDTMFLSQYGFLSLKEVLVQGDAAVQKSSIPINNYIAQSIDNGLYDPAVARAVYAEKLGVYMCSFNGVVTWVYHELFGGWAPWYGIAPQLLYASDNTLYAIDKELLTIASSANVDTLNAGSFPINYEWEPAPFRSGSQEAKARWNKAEVIYESSSGSEFTLKAWLDLDKNTIQTSVTALAPNKTVVAPTGMVWGSGAAVLDPRTKWGGIGAGGNEWNGTLIAGNQLLAGSAKVPLIGKSEILSLSIGNADTTYFRISALEVYRNDGGIR